MNEFLNGILYFTEILDKPILTIFGFMTAMLICDLLGSLFNAIVKFICKEIK
jgi:hypothetical protein